MVIVDGAGIILLVNSQAERMFGYERAEIVGRPIETLVPERFRPRHESDRNGYLAAPRVRGMGEGLTLYGRRRDGTEVPVEISLSPIDIGTGRCVIASIRDVTERRRVERVLAEKNAELQAANEAKDRFFASMSHELRTPLNAILGFTGTMLMRLPGPLTTTQEDQLRIVQRSSRHLLGLINDLLDLARIGSGKLEVRAETIVCQRALAEIVEALLPAAQERGLALTSSGPEAPMEICTDARALAQILFNLTSNAIKFTERGSVHVTISAAGTAARFSVRDTGIGIAEADCARLFQPFARLESHAQEGSGLGLHVSQQLAHLLGGRISVESSPGAGSVFTLELPRPS